MITVMFLFCLVLAMSAAVNIGIDILKITLVGVGIGCVLAVTVIFMPHVISHVISIVNGLLLLLGVYKVVE